MANLLEQAINCNHGDRAAKIIQDALGIEDNDVVYHCFPKNWPADRDDAPASSATSCKARFAF